MRTKGAWDWCGVAVAALTLGLSGATSWAQTPGSSPHAQKHARLSQLTGHVIGLDSKVGIGR